MKYSGCRVRKTYEVALAESGKLMKQRWQSLQEKAAVFYLFVNDQSPPKNVFLAADLKKTGKVYFNYINMQRLKLLGVAESRKIYQKSLLANPLIFSIGELLHTQTQYSRVRKQVLGFSGQSPEKAAKGFAGKSADISH